MMKYITIILLLFFSTIGNFSYAQTDLILNGGFENRMWSYPNSWSDFSKLIYWTDDGSTIEGHTPDWFYEGEFDLYESTQPAGSNYDPNGVYKLLKPHSGKGFAGMLSGEMMIQEISSNQLKNVTPNLGNALDYEKAYKLTFYVKLLNKQTKPSDPGSRVGIGDSTPNFPDDSRIEVHIANGKMGYDNGWHCDDRWYDKSYGQGAEQTVKSIPLSFEQYPAGKWHKVETYLTGIDWDGMYDWLALEFVHDITANCLSEHPYILIDDVSLVRTDCSDCYTCSNKDGCIDIGINAAPEKGLLVITGLDNVSHAVVHVNTVLGQPILKLKFPNGIPKIVRWNYKDSKGNLLPAAPYHIVIEASNDCTTYETDEIVTFEGAYQGQAQLLPDLANPRKNLCCGKHLHIENEIFDKYTKYTVGSMSIGPNVKVKANTTLEIKSEEYIDVSPDFIVENSGQLIAYIEPCTYDEQEESNKRRKIINNDSIDNNIEVAEFDEVKEDKGVKRIEEEAFSVMPNPTADGIFSVVLPQNMIESQCLIEIYNTEGQIILQSITNATERIKLNISDYPPGVYFIKVKIGDKTLKVQRIVRL